MREKRIMRVYTVRYIGKYSGQKLEYRVYARSSDDALAKLIKKGIFYKEILKCQ